MYGNILLGVSLSSDEAIELAKNGDHLFLVRKETSLDGIHGMYVALVILTSRDGMTSHTAVVTNDIGIACIYVAGDVLIDNHNRTLKFGDKNFHPGDIITMDGYKGEVLLGKYLTVEPELSGDFATVMQLADEIRRLRVKANAETLLDASTGRRFGSKGIGLVKTEQMFFSPE